MKTHNIAGVLLLGLLFLLDVSIAQAGGYMKGVEIPSSFNPVGSGARALGMGGAFIAVADDATAASWNPAGLIQLEQPEISIASAGFHRTETNTFSACTSFISTIGNNLKDSMAGTDLNYLSAAVPFRLWNQNMVFSANYQHLYDFTRQRKYQFISYAIDGVDNVNYEQDGSLSALGLALAAQINPRVSIGVTLNIWDDHLSPNHWEERTYVINRGAHWIFENDYERYSFKGINFNLGLLWNINSDWTLGAVLKTPFDADVKHHNSKYTTTYPYWPYLPPYLLGGALL